MKPKARLTRDEARERIIDATIELVRERSYAELTVAEIMDRAGLERTIFYRHFENVGSLLLGAGREAIEELYAAQVALAQARTDLGPDAIRAAIEVPVAVYHRHGPLLRAVAEAVAADQLVAADQEEIRRRFDELVADALRPIADEGGAPPANVEETARALNLLNERYLLDAFGREPRVSVETASQTLSEIWAPVLSGRGP
jgi:AcrR family transcriptional regulator